MILFARSSFVRTACVGSKRLDVKCVAAIVALFFTAACQNASLPATEDWAAHGFMAPGPVGESEIIGLYYDRQECEQAAKDWVERQVVGNPVFADCYPIDKT